MLTKMQTKTKEGHLTQPGQREGHSQESFQNNLAE